MRDDRGIGQHRFGSSRPARQALLYLGRTPEPLRRPVPAEREDCAPNVVYSFGASRRDDQTILSYAVSSSNLATSKIAALLQTLSG
jgi:hypothetical protein